MKKRMLKKKITMRELKSQLGNLALFDENQIQYMYYSLNGEHDTAEYYLDLFKNSYSEINEIAPSLKRHQVEELEPLLEISTSSEDEEETNNRKEEFVYLKGNDEKNSS